MSPSVSVRLSFCLLLAASAACTEGEIETAAPVEQTHVAALADGGIALPDAALADAGTPAEELTTTLTTLAEFRGTVDVAAGTMRLEVLEGDAVTDAGLRRAQQGLCTLTIVQDGVAGSGPLNSLELVTGTTGLDASCEGYVASPLFCGAVTVRSFYTSPQTQVFAQIQSLAPSTGFSVQNGDVVPGASSGLGSWAYGDLGAASSAPANAGVRNWVFARSDGNFTFTGRLVANVTELCDGLDNDCDGLTDEGIGCRTQGQSCAATVDCSGTLVCTASVCSPAGCPSGQHLESGACVSDTRSCVATNATAATETWTGSAYGTCTISACSAGFALVANSCVGGCGNGVIGSGETCDDGNTVTEECAYGMTDCSVCNASCQTAMGETDFCTDNTLDPAEFCDDGNTINTDSCNNSCTCGTGYHAEGGICANDVQACTISNGTATETWTGSAYGACTPVSCNSTYHIESGACTSDTRSCVATNATAATETWTGSAYGACTATACASDANLVGGACIGILGAACTLNAECASGNCATGPDGTVNDRCAPTGMNYIPAGTFTMGSPESELGRNTDETEHSVTISRSFFMGQTEVTQGQWKALSGGVNPSCLQSTTGTAYDCTTSNANDSGPVEQMDWYAAVAFANARSAAEGLTPCYTLTGCADGMGGFWDGIHTGCTGATFAGLTCTGYRLPTESEWEYAARAGTTTATYGGDLSGNVFDCGAAPANLDGIAWWCSNSGNRTQAVGGKTANSFGLYDMLGNLKEWTGDWYDTYPGTVTDPTGATTGSYRMDRGGAWSGVARDAGAAHRDAYTPDFRSEYLGFRLARTVP